MAALLLFKGAISRKDNPNTVVKRARQWNCCKPWEEVSSFTFVVLVILFSIFCTFISQQQQRTKKSLKPSGFIARRHPPIFLQFGWFPFGEERGWLRSARTCPQVAMSRRKRKRQPLEQLRWSASVPRFPVAVMTSGTRHRSPAPPGSLRAPSLEDPIRRGPQLQDLFASGMLIEFLALVRTALASDEARWEIGKENWTGLVSFSPALLSAFASSLDQTRVQSASSL